MDQENRKTYYKNYYENNKTKILEKLNSKVNCEFCFRQVLFCNLNKHYTLPICERTQQKNKYIAQRQQNI